MGHAPLHKLSEQTTTPLIISAEAMPLIENKVLYYAPRLSYLSNTIVRLRYSNTAIITTHVFIAMLKQKS